MGVGTLLPTASEIRFFPAPLSHRVTSCPRAEAKFLVYRPIHARVNWRRVEEGFEPRPLLVSSGLPLPSTCHPELLLVDDAVPGAEGLWTRLIV